MPPKKTTSTVSASSYPLETSIAAFHLWPKGYYVIYDVSHTKDKVNLFAGQSSCDCNGLGPTL